MKKIHILIFSIAFLLCFVSCNRQTQEPVVLQSAESSDASVSVSTEETANSEPMSSEIEIATREVTEETLPPAAGGTSLCCVHSELYHGYPWPWIEYVGEENFEAWIQAGRTDIEPDENGCPYPKTNIYKFIHDFNYPKDVFIEQYNSHIWVDYGYQVDLLYGDDSEAAEIYYRITYKEDEPEWKKLHDSWALKWDLMEKYPEKLKDYGNWKTHSLVELMQVAGVDTEDLKDIVSQYEYGAAEAIKRVETCDFSAVESLTVNERKELMTEHSAFYQDCVLLGITPYETPYEKQVADNAAKSNGHEAS